MTEEELLPGPKVYFGLFGGVRAWRTQQRLELGPPQRRALLAILLAADGRTVSVSDLVDLIWAERPSASAVNLLHRHVGALRRLFEPGLPARTAGRWLVRSGSGYLVRVDATSCDVRRFRQFVLRAQDQTDAGTAADLWLRALELAAGEPGAGLPFPLAQAAPFQALERERVNAAVAAADAARRAGRERPVVPHLVAIAARHPLDEPLHARLIEALAGAGQRAEALAVFAGIRDRLAADLGVAPSPALLDAHRRVGETAQRPHGGRHPADVVARAGLPDGPGRLIGRERELTAAKAALTRPPTAGHRILAVTGEPGVGKTDFALYWAHQIADQFPDGQFYAGLRGEDRAGLSPTRVLRGLLDALGAPPPAPEADADGVAAAFRDAVRGRRLLFVLDDAAGSQQVRDVLPGDPNCLVVAVSRHCLTGLIAHEGAAPLPLTDQGTGNA
ncbi:AfsR/SARP family transcriptional regulator [Cryptosporangium phraense]|uniref:AAA family ATPase n=1 Tax=Cryptosporangium phraense TaxID=2593070 RepID=A0A545AXW8_9ACTN|nr:BTAD domain-containing putative transcriptional regulator [Cryptosporangium phraense]TQS46121.1 AAA family ATPase [Cryptosporangium phraense]